MQTEQAGSQFRTSKVWVVIVTCWKKNELSLLWSLTYILFLEVPFLALLSYGLPCTVGSLSAKDTFSFYLYPSLSVYPPTCLWVSLSVFLSISCLSICPCMCVRFSMVSAEWLNCVQSRFLHFVWHTEWDCATIISPLKLCDQPY